MSQARTLSGTLLAVLALGLAGCGIGAPMPHPALTGGHAVAFTVRHAYQVQATSHRWVAADVNRYDVTLRAWDGQGFTDMERPLSVALPQHGDAPKSRATFTNLKQGRTYQATVVAWGNVGGTAPDRILNTQTPAQATFTFEATQDVEALVDREIAVALDATPFSGTATLQPAHTPADTDAYEVQLEDAQSGAVFYVGTHAVTETITLRRLRVGVTYRVRLSARSNGVTVGQAASEPLYFDPQGQDLEQERTVAIAF